MSDDDLAFLSVAELGHLLKTKQIRSRELAELYLAPSSQVRSDAPLHP